MATYHEIHNSFVNGSDLRNRAVVAAAKYALYIYNEDPGTPNHEARRAWAEGALTGDGARQEVDAIKWALAADPAVLLYGDALVDADLQAVVETHLNSMRVPKAEG